MRWVGSVHRLTGAHLVTVCSSTWLRQINAKHVAEVRLCPAYYGIAPLYEAICTLVFCLVTNGSFASPFTTV